MLLQVNPSVVLAAHVAIELEIYIASARILDGLSPPL